MEIVLLPLCRRHRGWSRHGLCKGPTKLLDTTYGLLGINMLWMCFLLLGYDLITCCGGSS